MLQCQGYGATVTITDENLVIDRRGLLTRMIGPRQVVALGDVVGFHVRQPSMLTNGWIQLCVGSMRSELGRSVAPSDPHTVLFRRGQREQMGTLLQHLQQWVDDNRHRSQMPIRPTDSLQPSLRKTSDAVPAPAQVPLRASVVQRSIDVQVFTGPSFVGFDVETANGARGSICAIGLTVVTAGQITATHSWLCRPPEGLDRFDAGNTRIHGITAHDVARQPTFRQRLADMLDVVGDLPLIAHNAAFDVGALREASAADGSTWRPLDYGCTLQWSRRELPDLHNHKLPTVARALGVDLRHHHDASADASAAAEIALELMRRRGASSVDTYVTATGMMLGRATVEKAIAPRNTTRDGTPRTSGYRASATPPPPHADAAPEHPLFGHTVVVTGTLSGLSRDEAWSLLAKCGARVNKTVTRRTTVLVAGGWLDRNGRPQETEKLTEARRLQAAGQRITILDQRQMEALLAGDRTVPLPDLIAPATVDAYALADDSDIAPQNRNDPRQQVRGRHFTAWSEPVKQLKRDGRLDEALELLFEVIAVVERPENCWGGAPATGWTEQAAIVYRKQKNFAAEVAVLQRWIDAAHRNGCSVTESDPIPQRKAKAQALLEKSRS
ncbi:exonuclease domain-containing protein [Rhodococcus marinonascens]|uniref:exonuclease domain-containing protein n=1 Tax=Rhodococcus marinonascens TaxID=38311 RepID=UPI000934E2B8|nr:exonuclease domain-containing protein [Rhodococcus marinonascens]